jgi:hypothetical protein
VLTGSGSRLFKGSSLGLLFLKEESGGLNVAMCRSGLLLDILGLLDDGLELSLEGSGVGGSQHGECRGGGGALLRTTTGWWRCPRRGGSQRKATTLEGGSQKGGGGPRGR